jgi:S-adenosylmethionine hydrolase
MQRRIASWIGCSSTTDAGFDYGKDIHLTIRHNEQIVFDQKLPFHPSFGYVPKGDPVIYTNELMRISLAVSQGSFSEKFEIGYGPGWTVTFRK